jgi:hypothetical protein
MIPQVREEALFSQIIMASNIRDIIIIVNRISSSSSISNIMVGIPFKRLFMKRD